MFDDFLRLMSYDFIIRAFVVGIAISLCSALLGVPLVLKKYSMIGDGLSHVGFGTMTIALALNVTPIYVAVPVMLVAAYLLLQIRQNSKINADAAIAIISSTAIAVGITAASVSGGMNTDVYGYMFGSILAVSQSDTVISLALCTLVIAVFIIFYNKIFAVTFDEGFASAAGVKTKAFNVMLAMLTAATIIVGMRVVGTMLISGLIIFPAITGMRLFNSFKAVVIASGVISVVAFLIGMLLTCSFSFIPAGAGVVLSNFCMLMLATAISKIKNVLGK